MKYLVITLTLLLISCTSAKELPDTYVVCNHLYDSSRSVTTASFDNLTQIYTDNCPNILRNVNGECPSLIEIINLNDERVYLTDQEFENYKCEKKDNS